MSQTAGLVKTLKRALKAKGKTYADVAACLELSETSIKRLFAEKNFSLERLERICQLVEMDISDLVQSMLEETRRIDMLTEEQEEEVVGDLKLLLVAVNVLNRLTFTEMLRDYKLSEPELIQLLAKLDRLKIIQLLPKNRIKLIVAKNFSWRPNGPIQRFFHSNVQAEFFKSTFQKPGEKLIFNLGMLSRGSNASFIKKLEKLNAEFNELHEDDAGLPLEQRFGASIVLALRVGEFGFFGDLNRDPHKKVF
ncbi:MAG: helix-turn-helix transcriptional regulator [Cellvibrionaceae bacterium]